MPVGPLLESTKYDDDYLPKLLDYYPPFDLRLKAFKSTATDLLII
jgi:hypothetical protein